MKWLALTAILSLTTGLGILLTITHGKRDNIREYSRYTNRLCIEGHTYYSLQRGIAIKLNSNGKPIKCVGE